MNGIKSRLAPIPAKEREPIRQSTEVDYPYYTPVIGGNATGPAKGWEAIQPKPSSKPEPVIKALQAMNTAWDHYLWAIDAEADQGTIEAAWWDYDRAKADYYEAAEAAEADYMALYSPEAALSEVGS